MVGYLVHVVFGRVALALSQAIQLVRFPNQIEHLFIVGIRAFVTATATSLN